MAEALEPSDILDSYTGSLAPQQEKAKEAHAFGLARYTALFAPGSKTPSPIASKAEYEAVAKMLQEVDNKAKFLDQERKVTVTPLNDEVKRINGWYKPALDLFKDIRTTAESLLSAWILKEQREQQRLLREAEEAARKQLEATALLALQDPNKAAAQLAKIPVTQAPAPLVKEAADKTPPKVKGLSHKPAWAWSWAKDGQEKFVREMAKRVAAGGVDAEVALAFLLPDIKEVARYVSENGDKDVLPGVEVKQDVHFTNRSR